MTHSDRWGALLILAFSLGYAWLIQDIDVIGQNSQALSPRSMPTMLATLSTFLALWLLIKPGTHTTDLSGGGMHWGLAVTFCILMSAYGLGIRPLGFLLSTSLFLGIGFSLLGARSWLKVSAMAISVALVFWLLMSELLNIYIPPLPQALDG